MKVEIYSGSVTHSLNIYPFSKLTYKVLWDRSTTNAGNLFGDARVLLKPSRDLILCVVNTRVLRNLLVWCGLSGVWRYVLMLWLLGLFGNLEGGGGEVV